MKPEDPTATCRCSAEEGGPTPQFRRDSWAEFQRALDPLALPRPLRSAAELKP